MTIVHKPALARASALCFGGLLAGAFGYGAVNVLYAFREVPLDVRFTFHTALMSVNGLVMQSLMGLTVLSCLVLAFRTTGRDRLLAGSAAALAVSSFVITRLGNIPINQHIKVWAVSAPPADYAEILTRWEAFHFARTACALLAFLLIVTLTLAPAKRALP
ncbi:anthrone oxygenase family protein [Nocardia sp. NPDC052316]|uniref:anthrone oxygenase family protein n=1 Tax=Nocardia sp. NPDC052316 TaxID=3364329 RepID=UPI0037CA257C